MIILSFLPENKRSFGVNWFVEFVVDYIGSLHDLVD